MAKNNHIVGLDIGTTKICAIVGEIVGEGIDIVGIGSSPSYGLRKGVVVNVDSTVESIRKAVGEAELMAGSPITQVVTGIAGGHIKGFNSHGIVAIKHREVSEVDIRRVVEQARAVALPMDREVIHILPQEFIVDDQEGIKDPLGMSGVRLEARVHIVTGAITSAHNIIRCANRAGLSVMDIALEQLASSDSVLTPDEKEIGVALVDIGGGTTDVAIWHQGSVKHTCVIGLGGEYMTSDLATGLRTPAAEAEKIKKRFGCSAPQLVSKDEVVEVPSVGGRRPRSIPRSLLCEILEPRVEEIFTLVNREIVKSGFEDKINAGVVLTGGSALLPGMTELGEKLFEMPVRVGRPIGIGGLTDVVNSPMYSTGVGLVIYGMKNRGKGPLNGGNLFTKIFERMKELAKDFF